MRYLFPALFSIIVLTACSPIIEKHITMNRFNKTVNLEKVKLASPVSVELIYDPKIDIHINKQYGFFLQHVDTLYIDNIREHLIKELAEVNIHVTGKKSVLQLSIDEIRLIEKLEEGTDSRGDDTTEIDVELYMKGHLYNTSSNDQQLIEAIIGTTTYTGLSLFSVLFNDSDFDVQKNDTYEAGVAEKNLITLFVKKCSQNIH